MAQFTLHDLAAIVAERAGSTAEASYTKSLLDAGIGRTAKKFGEEAVEAVIAAVEGDKVALTNEAADVLYHLVVMLQAGGITLDEIMAVLAGRTIRSGHEEKAARHT